MLIRSEALTTAGFAHAFSLRTGGVSVPPFDSLNLARTVGDSPKAVAENQARFAAAVGYERLYEVSQVHGNSVVALSDDADMLLTREREADAIVSFGGAGGQRAPDVTRARVRAKTAIGVRVADCVPVLIGEKRTGRVAAIHAGWRGAIAGVVQAGVNELTRLVVDAECVAAIGPHIRACCFEVGDDVARTIADTAPQKPLITRNAQGRAHADLTVLVRQALTSRRVQVIDDVGGCTMCDPARFFSYRRDGASSGRHLAVIRAQAL